MPPSGPQRDTVAVAATTAPAKPLSRKRRIVVWTLVVLASILALVSILTTWVNRQMLDNTAWNKATTQVIQDPKVQSAIATYTINQLYSNVNVGQALADRLPKNLKQLGPPLAGALEQPATQGVALLLQRPRVQQLFIRASTIAHEKLVNVLENKTGFGISTGSGVVTLDVHQMIVEVGTELGLPQSALAKLPAKAGNDHADEVRPAVGRAGRHPGRCESSACGCSSACSSSTGSRSTSRAAPGGRRCATRASGSRSWASSPSSCASCWATTSSARSRSPATSRRRTGCG